MYTENSLLLFCLGCFAFAFVLGAGYYLWLQVKLNPEEDIDDYETPRERALSKRLAAVTFRHQPLNDTEEDIDDPSFEDEEGYQDDLSLTERERRQIAYERKIWK